MNLWYFCRRYHLNVCARLAAQSCVALWPHGPEPTRLLCPWGSPDKNTGVACHFFLQGICPTQGWNLDLPRCRWILSCWAARQSLLLLTQPKPCSQLLTIWLRSLLAGGSPFPAHGWRQKCWFTLRPATALVLEVSGSASVERVFWAIPSRIPKFCFWVCFFCDPGYWAAVEWPLFFYFPLPSFLLTHQSLKSSVNSVQSLSRVRLFATPWIAACQAALSITNS